MTDFRPDCLPFSDTPSDIESLEAVIYFLSRDLDEGGPLSDEEFYNELTGSPLRVGIPPSDRQTRIVRRVGHVASEIPGARTEFGDLASLTLLVNASRALKKLKDEKSK